MKKLILKALREDTPKKIIYLVLEPLRGGGGVSHYAKKNTFFYKWRKFTRKLCNKMLFYEVRHFTPQTFLLIRKQYLAKKIRLFNTKNLGENKLSKSVSGYSRLKKERKKVEIFEVPKCKRKLPEQNVALNKIHLSYRYNKKDLSIIEINKQLLSPKID